MLLSRCFRKRRHMNPLALPLSLALALAILFNIPAHAKQYAAKSLADFITIQSTPLSTGDKGWVTDSGIRYLFIYDGSSSATHDSPLVLQPSDSPATGRWLYDGGTLVATAFTANTTLTVIQLWNQTLSNAGASGALEFDFPARTEGWNFIFVLEAVQNVTLDPNGSEQWYLNGDQLAAGEAIENTSPVIGESIFCYSTGSNVFCESSSPNFVEETP